MWSLYMNEAKDYDTRLTTLWKDDADSLLVFTGIFASIATASVIESYKKLSPDPGDRTIALLEQISQQLSGAANGTFVPPSTAPPFSPSFSIICCNIMWLLSLVLGITSAMCATLMKQWARRYVNLPQIPSEPSRSARVRSFLFLGILKYQVLLAVDLPTTLLHLSVFFFGIGLLFFFYTIFTTVAIFLSVAVGILGFAYFILTILPWVDRSCPYNTPWSGIFWFFWHTFIPSAAFCLHWLSRKLHGIIMPQTLGQVTSSWRGTLASGWTPSRRASETI
ncbi:hypothetical protein B0F90DRAFT_1632408 [Multifurca ochricompacta]|uniref:DUF6535 domain-containing protein n=1 Tax=Multifurca ochricompacta TaxID=376703 RepID=A0AAD4M1D8_9AGAM|nr:hypothetical protein B0F90DRAFT_1632408 [Multifurca ochricompacta]